MPRTKGATDIDNFTRGRVVGRVEGGQTRRKVAKELSLSVGAVQHIYTSFRVGNATSARRRPGRPAKHFIRNKRRMERLLKKGRRRTLSELACAAQMSERSARRLLHKIGYRGCIAKKKPLLSPANVENRLQWGSEMITRSPSFWTNVIFSDESKFELFGEKRVIVWRKPGEELHEDCLQGTVKFGGGSVMVWGCVWYSGRSTLSIIEGRLNALEYNRLLEENLLPLYDRGDLTREANIFQEDNAPCHKAKSAVEWKKQNGITVLPWPAQSPDMNPIEHVWNRMDYLLRKINPRPKNVEQVKNALVYIWGTIEQSYIQKIIDSMASRLEALVEAGGKSTRY